jgi:hypothetical protein
MHWVTLSHVHLDRAATPWLVRRFVDPDAVFGYVEWGLDGELPTAALLDDVPEGAIPLAIPGAKLGLHDADGTCFSKVLREYELDDPALWQMERIVAAGVSHALGTPPRLDETDEERTIGHALDEIGTALGIMFDDTDHIDRAMALYDAVFALCQMRQLPDDVLAQSPSVPPLRTPYLRAALARQSASDVGQRD